MRAAGLSDEVCQQALQSLLMTIATASDFTCFISMLNSCGSLTLNMTAVEMHAISFNLQIPSNTALCNNLFLTKSNEEIAAVDASGAIILQQLQPLSLLPYLVHVTCHCRHLTSEQ